MARAVEIVVTLDGALVEPERPILWADDPTFARGDGVFETLLVRGGRPCLLEPHLARLTRSAVGTGLPTPDLGRWRHAIARAAARWPDSDEAVLRLVHGRGRGDRPTAFATLSAVPARVAAARRDGLSAVTLDRGLSAIAGAEMPWSISGAKSLSYAANAAALRQAEHVGVGDAVFVSADGFVLEGPRSSVVIVDGDGVLVTPPDWLPILAGTTVQALFETARARGYACDRRLLRVADLDAAQAVWLLSSVTLAARVHTLDGVVLPAGPDPVGVASLLDEALRAEL